MVQSLQIDVSQYASDLYARARLQEHFAQSRALNVRQLKTGTACMARSVSKKTSVWVQVSINSSYTDIHPASLRSSDPVYYIHTNDSQSVVSWTWLAKRKYVYI